VERGSRSATKAARPGEGRARAAAGKGAWPPGEAGAVVVRPVRRADLDQIVALDARVTGLEKRAYWQSLYRRYGASAQAERQFLVAEAGRRVVGFVIGEVRDWEFGSPPCGWVFGIDVHPDARLAGVGTNLLAAICAAFRRAGVRKVRTMLARDNNLILSFFRSQGMMAGPFIPLEMDLEP
jgi:ribosomal protein S18 acetylase RimI-like enzyme